MKINWWPPALVYTTDNLPDNVGGRTNAFVVRVKSKYENDEGLRQHEFTHVAQFWCSLGLHLFVYPLSREWRFWAEMRAYQHQMKYPDRDGNCMTVVSMHRRMSFNNAYNFNMTEAEVAAKIAAYPKLPFNL